MPGSVSAPIIAGAARCAGSRGLGLIACTWPLAHRVASVYLQRAAISLQPSVKHWPALRTPQRPMFPHFRLTADSRSLTAAVRKERASWPNAGRST